MLQPQSLSPPIRRTDSLRYATSAVGEGRKRWSDVRPAFVNSYPGVCGRRREGQTRVRAGGRPRLPPVPAVSLPPRRPPPARRQLTGTLSGDGGRADGQAMYAAALADRRGGGVGLHTKTTLLRGYLQQVYCSYLR